MDYKKLKKFSFLDGIIVLIANLNAILIPRIFKTADIISDEFKVWLSLAEKFQAIVSVLIVITFIIPLIMCSIYIHPKNKDEFPARFVNSPLMFSLFGCTGWLLSLVITVGFLFYAKATTGIHILNIFLIEFVFALLSAMITFATSFLLIEIYHRKFILKKFFPEGHLSRFGFKIKPTFKIVSWIVYYSIALFPITLLIFLYYEAYINNPDTVDLSKLIIVLILVVFGFLIQIGFSLFFTKPIKKLMEGVSHIKDGDFDHKIDFVSNDDLGELSDTINDMNQTLVIKNKKIQSIQDSVIKGMAMMVESRDNSTGGHINRTSAYVQLFAKSLLASGKYPEINETFVDNVMKAAPMHDLGKIAVDDAILRKPGKFTDEEYEKMKAHAAEGARIVSSVLKEVDDQAFKQIAINVAHYHHEKWNGQGYPEKIQGTQIPLEARIMALADVYDALVSKRCYKDQFSYDRAFDIIKDSAGSHFDPELTEVFLNCRPELEELTCLLGAE